MKILNLKLIRGLMMIILLCLYKLSFAKSSFSLDTYELKDTVKNSIVEDTILSYAEKMPEFPGGKDSMKVFLVSKVRFPEEAYQKGIYGRVIVQFVVNKFGKISHVKVIKRIGGGCDEEVIRVVKQFPDWIPAQLQGKPVSVYYNMPILFKKDENTVSYEDQSQEFLRGEVSLENSESLSKKIDEQPGDEPLIVVEQMPEFPGGISGMMKFLSKNIRYPSYAIKMGITGRVIVQFVVDKQGNVVNVKILRGIGGGCDEEAIRVVKAMPPWQPGRQKGKIVPVYFTLPIVFQ